MEFARREIFSVLADQKHQEAKLASNPYLVATLGAMLLPIFWSLIFCLMALRLDEPARTAKWSEYVQAMRALNLLTVPVWWSLCTALFANDPGLVQIPGWPRPMILILPLTVGIVGGRLLTSWTGRNFRSHHWTGAELLGFILWRTLSSTVPLLMLAAGIDAIDNLRVSGTLWIIAAAILALFATLRLRAAEGFKPRRVKSGELYKQSSAIAQRMGLPLKGILITSAGRGRLINAFSIPGYIGMTDLCVHRIRGPQRDFFIAHELSHIRLRHNGKKLPLIAGAFLAMAAFSFILPHVPVVMQVLVKSCLILISLAVLYSVSRRFEYAADRVAVEFTGDAESAIRALTALYHYTGVPPRRGKFVELFQTHPSCERRINAIAHMGEVPAEMLSNIRQQFYEREERLAGST